MLTPIQPDVLDWTLDWNGLWTGLDWIRRIKAFLLIPTLRCNKSPMGRLVRARNRVYLFVEGRISCKNHLIAVRE